MIHSHQPMLSPVLELVKSTESYTPLGNHSMFQKLWTSETESLVKESLQMGDGSEVDKETAYNIVHLASDALSIFLREASNPSWSALTKEERLAKVKAIQDAPQIPQRSEEWYKQYGKVLTASEFSALFVQNKKRQDLVYSKSHPPQEISTKNYRLACPTEEMNAIGWGIRFESVVKLLLEHKDKVKVYESGRLNHKINTHLAASPDGVIEEALHLEQLGRLIEIKCPYSRAIGGEIPSDYWIQMQIQMEVADVDECEYIECDIVSPRAKQQNPVDLSGTTYTGVVYLLKQVVEDDQPFDYKYLYGDIGSSERPSIPDGYECIETIPWGLKRWHRKVVSRDRKWYEGTLPWQEAFWEDVAKAKKGQLTASVSKPTACLITDD
jgi:hypothetical protein